MKTTMASGHRLYENRPDCPVRHHNTVGSYRMGCRCPEAVEARRVRDKRRRQHVGTPHRVDATGTTRRLQALLLAGHRAADIATQLRTSPDHIRDIARGSQQWVYLPTRDAVRALCHRWADRPGPSPITASRARAAGYVSILAWDDIDDPACQPNLGTDEPDDDTVDEVAVARVVAGKAPFTALRATAERAVAVATAVAAGRSRSAVARAAGISWARVVELHELGEQLIAERRAVAA